MARVIVIGGGPAGSSFATRTAQLGHDVTLIERLAFPRRRLGESLTPGVLEMLGATGARHAVEQAQFPKARDVRISWEGETVFRTMTEGEGLLVDRGVFDQKLLEHAMHEGVRVVQPARILSQDHHQGEWQVLVEHDGAREMISADFLADARGRSALAGKKRKRMGEPTIGIFGYWRGNRLPRHATLSAGENGWVWGIPLPGGVYNAQVFISPSAFRSGADGNLGHRYRQLLAASDISEILNEAELEGDVMAVDATPFLVTEPVTAHGIRLGDAAMTIDPVSSSGVQKAIQSALSAAIVANTLLRRPEEGEAAGEFYRDSLSRTAARHQSWAAVHYAAAANTRGGPFWTSRAATDIPTASENFPLRLHDMVALSPAARLVDHPCLGLHFVERRAALVHPALDGPVAYLDNQHLAPLLSSFVPATLAGLAQQWSARMPPARACAIVSWLRHKGVLVPASAAGGAG